jgi:type II secretory ATPase GspE/PulE/Tfp pilus assembly ATPase PilB-like protein
MRILRPEVQRDKSLHDLGLTEEQSILVLDAISREQGLIVIAGPTGSGKTTTIYSVLSILAKKDKNIVTLEDPIEYVIPGIRQVQVSESVDFGFSKALRALLRQDPDVIVIGEIRDSDTAQLAFQASLTGHLVICTIHAEDCAGVYARLSNLGVHKDMMHSLVLMISQRLVDVSVSVDACAGVDFCDDGTSGVPRISNEKATTNKSDGRTTIKRVGIFEVIPVTGTTKVTLFQNSYPEYIRKALRKQGVLLLEDSMSQLYTKNSDETKSEIQHPSLPSKK